MRSSHLRLFALPSTALVLAVTAVAGCSSSDSAPQIPVADGNEQTPSADAELAALGITDDELIADEAGSEDELLALDWPQATDDEPDGDMEDYSMLDETSPEVLPDPPPSPVAASFSDTVGLGVLATPTWWTKQFSCPSNPLHASCTCRGSLYNCQFANDQTGRNRYLPARAIRALRGVTGKARTAIVDKLGRWDYKSGEQLYDGVGKARGALKSPCYSDALAVTDTGHPCIKVNFGQLKKMKVDGSDSEKQYVYAFDVLADGHGASGWALAAGITDPGFKRYDLPPRSGSHFATTSYVVKSAEDYGCAAATYVSTTCLPSWAQLKIRPKSGPKVSEKARDYMLRDGSVLNLAYQTPLVGGAATDTFTVTQSGLGFKRLKSIDADHRTILRISLYDTMDANHAGTKVVGKMYFIYGEMAGRFGWVASSAVKQGAVATAPTGYDTCADKADGLYCSQINPGAFECKNGAFKSGQYCVAPAKCVGPNGPGATIICQ